MQTSFITDAAGSPSVEVRWKSKWLREEARDGRRGHWVDLHPMPPWGPAEARAEITVRRTCWIGGNCPRVPNVSTL